MWLTHIGTDEAGYGPTLGPLVITATVWQSATDRQPDRWYELLAPYVTSTRPAIPRRSKCGNSKPPQNCDPIVITDSKKIYQSGHGLHDLERTALSLVGLVNRVPKDWYELMECVTPGALPDLSTLPWFVDFNPVLPVECPPAALDSATIPLRDAMDKAGLRCVRIHSQFLTAMRFNRELDRFSSKGELLSRMTLQLVSEVLSGHPEAILWADRHGGRAHYVSLLYQVFETNLVQIEHELPEESSYRVSHPNGSLKAVFLTKAERLLPVAAASIISKYLRELAMLAFNRFWQRHLPGLAATAGYPLDAKRFLDEIAPVQEKLGIAPDLIRRKK